jgi:uncharacterized protein YndB with AHSA1/START domain
MDRMAQVTATAERTIDAPAEKVVAALADYATTRPRILTEHYSDYRVEPDGRVHWRLQATKSRVRDQLVAVDAPGDGTVVERDANSSMVTTWTVVPAGEGRSLVTATTTWNGAGGVGGFFERTFAPRGLARIHSGVLENLEGVVRA